MTTSNPRLLTVATSIGVALILGAGCAAGTGGTTSSTAPISGVGAGAVGSGANEGSTGAPARGTDNTATDLDAVAITVLYAGTKASLVSEFVRPMPNFVFTYRGRVVSSNRDGAVERSVSPSQVRNLLDRAEGLGLFDGGAIPPGQMVPDGPYAEVTMVREGRRVVLEAQSLLEEETDPKRKALRTLIEEATELAADAKGEKPYRPVSYLFRAKPVQQDVAAVQARPWPVDLVSPADAEDCAEITARAWGGEMDTDANPYYSVDDQLYSVAAIPALPGQAC